MCIFCNSETQNEELEKYFTEKCNNCNGKIIILKKNDKIIVTKFSKFDKLRKILLLSPTFVIGLFIFLIIFGRVNQDFSAENAIRILLMGLNIFFAFYVYCYISNLVNFKKRGFMFNGLITIIKINGNKKRIIFSKIKDYIFIIMQVITIIIFCSLIFGNLVW